MDTKHCPQCNQNLLLINFHKNKNTKSGYCSWCKTCSAVNFKKVYENNRNKYFLNSIKKRAEQKDIPFDLNLEDIVFPEKCPVFGFNLSRNEDYQGPAKNSPSVDRIDPSKGYVKDNIQIISHLANAMKQNATPEELVLFAKWVLRTYGA